jgi:hypothetical protein
VNQTDVLQLLRHPDRNDKFQLYISRKENRMKQHDQNDARRRKMMISSVTSLHKLHPVLLNMLRLSETLLELKKPMMLSAG